MVLVAGAITQQSVGDTFDNLYVAAPTGGTGPYTYQWYRSQTNGFSPGGGNILAGKTAQLLQDSGLLPNTIYYYKNIVTDTGHSNDTATSAQLAVTTTQQTQSPNQFSQSVITGVLDLRLNFNTIAVQIDPAETGVAIPGSPLVFSDSAVVGAVGGNTLPLVVLATAITDNVCGFANYNMKNANWTGGDVLEMSAAGNVMYLMATTAISRGARVMIDVLTKGGIKPIASTGNYVGYTLDKAQAAGQNVRVMIQTPSFTFAS
jgi:hypothetical protein